MAGRPGDSIVKLAAAAALAGSSPVRREVRVALARERGLCHVVLDELDDARACFTLALEAAGNEGALADPARAALATLDVMAGQPRRAQARLSNRGRDRRATLIAQARVHLYKGAGNLADGALQACEQAPGGSSDLDPPSAMLRALVHVWEDRPEQARMLYDGVGTPDNPYWELVRILISRAFWVRTGDSRYLLLALSTAEPLRFRRESPLPTGMLAAACAHHAMLLNATGQIALALEAADEAFGALGDLTLPEWPRLAVLHDLAIVYRDADSPERWQQVMDAVADAPRGPWPERLRLVTGPRADGALDAPHVADEVEVADHGLGTLALALLDSRDAPRTGLLRALVKRSNASGGTWRDPAGQRIAAVGTSWSTSDDVEAVEVALPEGDMLTLVGGSDRFLAMIDIEQLGRLTTTARRTAEDIRREAGLRQSLEDAEAARRHAIETLERTRRGSAAAVTGGRFPSVAGRSPVLREALDRLGLLASTNLPVVLEGPTGSGRRHLARAFDMHIGGQPERCPVLDMALVPRETMRSTILRLEGEAAGGCFILANAEHLQPDIISWFLGRIDEGAVRGRAVMTLTEGADEAVADAIRHALPASVITLTGLDERLEDLPGLIDSLTIQAGKRAEQIGTGARAVLARRSWPGNITELRELITRAAVRAGAGTILPEHLSEAEAEVTSAALSESMELGYHDAIKTFRRELLRHALQTTGGNRTRAAELLGVQRTYFMRLIRDLGADDIPPAA